VEDQEIVKQLVKMNLKAKVVCLTRCLKSDIDVVGECGGKYIIVEGNANPWSCKATWGINENQIINDFVDTIKYANKNNINVSAMPWDDFRAPLPFLERLYKSIVYEGGASRVVISDTSGNSLPWTTTYIIKKLRKWLPEIPIEMHAHNEFGLATIDMIAAVVGGASFVHTCINGLGNRAGNAATEEVAMILELLLGISTGIDLSKIYSTSKLVEKLTKIPVPPNKAIVGDNLFTYEAGLSIFMFQKMKEHGRPIAYVPFVPELIGRDKYNFVLGKQSGKSSVRLKLKELGITVPEEELEEIVIKVKKEAIARKDIVPLSILKNIVDQVKSKKDS
jgi:2-isopropylmalate synthase